MDPVAQFGISLLSERLKNLICSLQVFTTDVEIILRRSIELKIVPLFLVIGQTGQIEISSFTHFFLDNFIWIRPQMSTRNWIDHCLELTNNHRLNKLIVEAGDNQEIDMDGFYRSLIGLHIKTLELKGTYSRSIQLFGSLSNVDTIVLDVELVQTTDYQRMVVLNHTKLVETRTNRVKFSLNDLLASNASFLQFTNLRIPDTQLNLFLKHWIAGSNQRQEGFSLTKEHDEQSYNQSVILKGIETRPAVRRSEHHKFDEIFTLPQYSRTLDITNCDGVEATVYFGKSWLFNLGPVTNLCCMLVWG